MQSFVQSPEIHAAALKNPALAGGPYINYPASRARDVQALVERTRQEQAPALRFAQAMNDLEKLLAGAPPAMSLEGPYKQVPDLLQVRVHYFGHACVLLESRQASVLTDTVVVPRCNGGQLADPSLKLLLRAAGFRRVVEIDELETIEVPGGSITGLPFFGEHGDLDIRSKIAHLVQLEGKRLLMAADSNAIEPAQGGPDAPAERVQRRARRRDRLPPQPQARLRLRHGPRAAAGARDGAGRHGDVAADRGGEEAFGPLPRQGHGRRLPLRPRRDRPRLRT
jgi:diiron non-heme beta-hydroxylase-like protein